MKKGTSPASIKAREVRGWVDLLKKDTPCADCGGWFEPVQMDFDHMPGTLKLDSVSRMVGRRSWGTILAEIEKCDLVCANCHRLRTRDRIEEPWGKAA